MEKSGCVCYKRIFTVDTVGSQTLASILLILLLLEAVKMLQIVEDVNEPLWLFADASVAVVVVPGTDYHLVLLTNRLLLRKFIRGS